MTGVTTQPFPFLAGGGASGQLARATDWSRTPLGPPDGWSHSLRTIASVILQSRHPMFLWWGPALIQIYNDAYLPSFGAGKHPAAMGQAGRECWQEIWPIIGPQIDDVLAGRRSTWNEDHLVPIFRNGRIEEVYWTYGYSPVLDDDGSIGGVLVVCTETTSRVIAERRSRTMRTLAERTALMTDAGEMLDQALEVLAEAPADVPFALIYRFDRTTGGFALSHGMGLPDLGRADALVLPRLSTALFAGPEAPRLFSSVGELPGSPWPEPCSSFFVAPLSHSPGEGPSGVIVFGLSPRLPFDETYRNHLDQIAAHLALTRSGINAFRIRAAAEDERNNLLLQAPVATALLIGPEHVFQLANPLYCQMVGRLDLVGKRYLEAFPELASTAMPGILDGVYRTGEPFCTQELNVRLDREGKGQLEECYFRFNLEPLRDGGGDVYGMMAVAVDITEQVRARQALERTHRDREKLVAELEAASRAKDEFLAMLGHELRNPLSPIATAVQLMRLKSREDADPAQADPTRDTTKEQQVIERQVNHLTRLVDDLLDVSKITRGKVELRKEVVEVADIVGKALEMTGDLFEQRNHRITVDVGSAPLRTDGDPIRLAQVVANLLTNAARYTEPGGHIQVLARREGSEIVIRVKDNGPGIEAELLPRIFDLFVQGQRSADRAQGGLGLGLALVKNLVALHGGRVQAISAGPGQGSEFVIGLDAVDGVASSTAATSTAATAATAFPAAGRPTGRRVLVVDDNTDAADTLGELLRAEGHDVAIAYTAAGALAAVEGFQPEVAVLDIGLPVMDGYELAAHLRAHRGTADCRLIALTGYGQMHDRARSENSGFEHHLVKPVDIDQLTRLVERPTG